jgi:hypothetical protein
MSVAGVFRSRLTVLCCLGAWLLSGCGTVAGVLIAPVAIGVGTAVISAGVASASNASPKDLAVPGMGGTAIDYPITDVYRALINVAEADGRKIVETDEAGYALRVSYPFSLLANNWGGEITIHCVVDGYGTRVIFAHDGHDADSRVMKIEAKLLDDTQKWLGSQPGKGS